MRAEFREGRHESSFMKDSPLKVETILVPTDFSATAEKALAYAAALARRFRARISLLHVITPLPYPVDMLYVPADQSLAISPARKKLDALAKAFIPSAQRGAMVARMGVPHETIADYDRSEKMDLIVIGTHGRSGLKHLLLGSIAERVVQKAPCPVLTVKTKD